MISKEGQRSPIHPLGEEPLALATPARGGLHVLHSDVGISYGSSGIVPRRPYSLAIQKLQAFLHWRAQRQGREGQGWQGLWLYPQNVPWSFYAPALESRGLLLGAFLFVESAALEKTLGSLCEEALFDVIVVELPASLLQGGKNFLPTLDSVRSTATLRNHPQRRRILHLAQRWLKASLPAQAKECGMETAHHLENRVYEKLFLLLD